MNSASLVNKRGWSVLVVVAMAAMAVSSGAATATTITLQQKTLADLLQVGDTLALAASPNPTPLTADNLLVDVYSAAYHSGSQYVYFYQVDNIGPTSTYELVSAFSISPFAGISVSSDVGYLSGDVADAVFGLTGGQVPDATANLTVHDTVHFRYDVNTVDVGQHSRVMYIVSAFPPHQGIGGNVEDGTIASGVIVGPIPEPATIALLTLGFGFVAVRRKRH